MEKRTERTEQFLDVSALLTGFGRVQLLGTGMADGYLRALDAALPAGVLDELLSRCEALPAGAEREAAAGTEILGDPKLGPVARNLILMWYCGTSPDETHRLISADAYLAGLQWVVAGGHPMGARQQGFGAWAVAPEGVAR